MFKALFVLISKLPETVQKITKKPWRFSLVVLSPPATEETEAMGREIESR
jgi:hypothetical protein